MTKGDVREVLSTLPLFTSCSKRELSLLAGIAEQLDFAPGDVICEEGEADLGLHVVVAGSTRVLVAGEERRKLGPGAFFGEISLLDGGPRSATVVADADVSAVYLPAWGFNAVLKDEPSLAIKMMKELCRRIRENDQLQLDARGDTGSAQGDMSALAE